MFPSVFVSITCLLLVETLAYPKNRYSKEYLMLHSVKGKTVIGLDVEKHHVIYRSDPDNLSVTNRNPGQKVYPKINFLRLNFTVVNPINTAYVNVCRCGFLSIIIEEGLGSVSRIHFDGLPFIFTMGYVSAGTKITLVYSTVINTITAYDLKSLEEKILFPGSLELAIDFTIVRRKPGC